jgi:hypothetical protein
MTEYNPTERAVQRTFISIEQNSPRITRHAPREIEGDVMERRHFLKLAVGFAAGAAGATALAASAQAAPLSPQLPLANNERSSAAGEDLHPAVTTEAEVERLAPEQVRWGHHWHRHWHRRHWGWHHRWHRRHWRRWHRRHWY